MKDGCLALGVEAAVLVPFDRYRSAVEGLSLPSSLARGLHGGAIAAERVDKLIQALARCCRMQHPLLDTIVGDVNDRLVANRTRAAQLDVGRQPDTSYPVDEECPVKISGAS